MLRTIIQCDHCGRHNPEQLERDSNGDRRPAHVVRSLCKELGWISMNRYDLCSWCATWFKIESDGIVQRKTDRKPKKNKGCDSA
jgi:hypothetical protein